MRTNEWTWMPISNLRWPTHLTWALNSIPLTAYDDFTTRMEAQGKNPAEELKQILTGIADSTPETIDQTAQAIDQFKKDLTDRIANWRQHDSNG